MHILIPQVLFSHSLKDTRGLRAPTKNLRTEPQPIRLNSLLDHNTLILPALLEVRITRPRRVRQKKRELFHIFKARINHPLFQFIVDIELASHCYPGHIEGMQVLQNRRVGLKGAVIAPAPDGAFLDLEVAAWFYVVEDLCEELRPVCDAPGRGV